jgi:hypothetical protein
MAPIGYSGPFAKLIHKQNQTLKISCQAPFINFTYGDLCAFPFPLGFSVF